MRSPDLGPSELEGHTTGQEQKPKVLSWNRDAGGSALPQPDVAFG